MFLSVALAAVLGQAPLTGTSELQRFQVATEPNGFALLWSDAEERMTGFISPRPLHAGVPFQVSVHVGVVEGAEFIGPVTFGLHRPGFGGGQSKTVTPDAARSWVAELVPDEVGEHVLEVSYRSTHLKVARTTLTVGSAVLPAWFGWAAGATVILILLAVGARQVFKKPEPRASDVP